MAHIWQALPKPIFVLAPMEDVTDTVFRRIVATCARPDLYVTEFTNADGLMSEGHTVVSQRLKFTEDERPIVAQIWGKNPAAFYEAAKLIAGMGFDGIDINFGCPERSVVKNGCCAAMIGNEEMVGELVGAVKRGLADAGRSIPVSIKTRLGNKTVVTESWIPFLLSLDVAAITVHGRTAQEMSAVPAHWDEIGKAVQIRNEMKKSTLIIGNGDARDAVHALELVNAYGVDGVMIGRGIFENLWAFDRTGKRHRSDLGTRLGIMKRHVGLFDATWGSTKNYATLRKFFKIYVRGFEGASEWREKVMMTKSPAEVYPIIDEMIRLIQ